ncbi:hypothetical protein KQX54_019731 [Cotesia glomerata]|uniref:Uncharacterized protein n=1 Tax=Cotesia glomerata TaxID=32391 RepID=A0AAV7I2V8_COTGL|nr:hypothetical protein KQX54_019731 [Cotesia glomerata]
MWTYTHNNTREVDIWSTMHSHCILVVINAMRIEEPLLGIPVTRKSDGKIYDNNDDDDDDDDDDGGDDDDDDKKRGRRDGKRKKNDQWDDVYIDNVIDGFTR